MIFLGLLFNRTDEKKLLDRTRTHYVQNQANTFQWNIIDGFIDNGIIELSIINVLPIGTWPRQYSQLILESRDWNYNGIKCFEVGAMNIPFIKQYCREQKIRKLLTSKDDHEIIIYSAYLPFLKAVYCLPSEYKITMIVTDLPEFYDLGKTNVLKCLLRKYNNSKIYKYVKRIDRFILLTEQMNSVVNKENKPHIVVEGIAGSDPVIERIDTDNIFRVFYVGTLNKRFGVKSLIDECLKITEKRIELHLFGTGDCFDYAKEISLNDSRLIVHGFVSKEELNEKLKMCNLLVNPRTNTGEYTKYSFPSKTMECLHSGIPFLGYKLDGIPDEYDNYISYVDDSIKSGILQIANDYDFYLNKAQAAIKFVEAQKNRTTQAKRIIDFIEG